MPDTKRGNFPDKPCSDCKEMGTIFEHWGPLVPDGQRGSFCDFCWSRRQDRRERGEAPLPLGVKPPGVPEEFSGKAIKVTTQSGSVYNFSTTEKEGARTVYCDKRQLTFSKCRIICLIPNESMYLKPLNSSDPDTHGWWTTPVVSIE